MSRPKISQREALRALAEEFRGECNRLRYGRCTTLSCLKRGGYTTTPVNYEVATCREYEAAATLLAIAEKMETHVMVPREPVNIAFDAADNLIDAFRALNAAMERADAARKLTEDKG